MFVTLKQFFDNYRIKNGTVPTETTLNRGILRLKREVRELESVQNVILGNDLDEYNEFVRYEQDEYVEYFGKVYRSLVDGNVGNTPTNTNFWKLVEVVSLKALLKRIELLESKVN